MKDHSPSSKAIAGQPISSSQGDTLHDGILVPPNAITAFEALKRHDIRFEIIKDLKNAVDRLVYFLRDLQCELGRESEHVHGSLVFFEHRLAAGLIDFTASARMARGRLSNWVSAHEGEVMALRDVVSELDKEVNAARRSITSALRLIVLPDGVGVDCFKSLFEASLQRPTVKECDVLKAHLTEAAGKADAASGRLNTFATTLEDLATQAAKDSAEAYKNSEAIFLDNRPQKKEA